MKRIIEKKKSYIRVVYDARLIAMCERIRALFVFELAYFSSRPFAFAFQLDTQAKIRDYVIAHQSEITLDSGPPLMNHAPHSYPSLFAIYLCVIADLSKCASCDDALRQTDHTQVYPVITQLVECDNDESNCVCSHACCMANTFRVTNMQTGLMSLIGCDCLEKYELVCPVMLRAKKKEARAAAKTRKVRIAAPKVATDAIRERERQESEAIDKFLCGFVEKAEESPYTDFFNSINPPRPRVYKSSSSKTAL